MADFCKACSIAIFGEDFGDLSNLGNKPEGLGYKPEERYGYTVICEGCGIIRVNELGECIDCQLMRGKPGHGGK